MNIKKQEKIQRTFVGTVTSTKTAKTVTVKVDDLRMHPQYGKRYQVSRKYKVHDEKGEYRVGDVVRFAECRPLSRDKRWRVLGKVSK